VHEEEVLLVREIRSLDILSVKFAKLSARECPGKRKIMVIRIYDEVVC